MTDRPDAEALRLEALWSGEFGDAYVERNLHARQTGGEFWRSLLAEFPVRSCLEVGCNVGGNVRWLQEAIEPHRITGVDVNRKALALLHSRFPDVNAIYAAARELPFRDRWFDLTFTVGVLIHQPESTLPLVMSELVRCSRRYVLCVEYFAEQPTEVPYRGQRGALIKRNYGAIYQELFPELVLRKSGFLTAEQGFDDDHYWLFERP